MNPSIFNSDLFTMESLTATLQDQKYVPQQVSAMGLFETQGIATTDVWIEKKADSLVLVPTGARGSDGKVIDIDKRNAVNFQCHHISQRSAIMAESVQNVRRFGSDSELDGVELRINEVLMKHRRNLEYTLELHRIGAVKGLVLDADGSSVLYNLFTEFGVTQQTSDLNLSSSTYILQSDVLDSIIDKVENVLDGLPYTSIRVLCGRNFWKALIENDSIREAYLRYQSSANLVGGVRQPFEFGGVEWVRYEGPRATNSADRPFFIDDDEAYAIPMNVPDLFLERFGPADYMEAVNMIGTDFVAKSDEMRFNRGVELESQTNPLHICTRPDAVIRLTHS